MLSFVAGQRIPLTLCSIAILRTAGVASTFPLPLFICSAACGGGGEGAIDCDAVDCGDGGGGGRGSSIACVGLGFCWAAMTSSAGLGTLSASKKREQWCQTYSLYILNKVSSVEFMYNGWYVPITEMRIEAFKSKSQCFLIITLSVWSFSPLKSKMANMHNSSCSSNFDSMDVILECDWEWPFKWKLLSSFL